MAKATDAEIGKLVDRLCTLRSKDMTNLVDAAAIRSEIGNALKKFTQSHDHAKRTVDALMESIWRPTRAEISDAAKSTPPEPPPKYRPVNSNCGDCKGTGWVYMQKGQYTGVEACRCRRGESAA